MKYLVFTFLLFTHTLLFSQDVTAKQLLDKTIAYHDPNNTWSTFNGEFTVVMTTPNNSDRKSKINIDLPKELFSVTAKRDSVTTTYTINKGICEMRYNGKLLDSIQAKEKNLSCDRAQLYKNYYTYLYGLPMKLKDPGTNLIDTVDKKTFKGKDYLVLKVTYDEGVGMLRRVNHRAYLSPARSEKSGRHEPAAFRLRRRPLPRQESTSRRRRALDYAAGTSRPRPAFSR